jgi:hypothetical protein
MPPLRANEKVESFRSAADRAVIGSNLKAIHTNAHGRSLFAPFAVLGFHGHESFTHRPWLLLDSRVVAAFAFAGAMIFQDKGSRGNNRFVSTVATVPGKTAKRSGYSRGDPNPVSARPSPWNPIRTFRD